MSGCCHLQANFYTARSLDIIRAHPHADPLWLHLTYQNVHAPYVDPPAWECRDFPGFWDNTFGNMLWQLDSGVGNVTDALKTTGLWDTTLLL